jgi:DNA-binding transcriptional ArsR family regulator
LKDIQAYIFITYYAEKFEMDEETILFYLNKKKVLPFYVTPRELRLMRDYPPPTKFMCHALREEGFTVGRIAEYLKIPQPNVSYHLRTKLKQDWLHPTWQAMREFQLRQERQF